MDTIAFKRHPKDSTSKKSTHASQKQARVPNQQHLATNAKRSRIRPWMVLVVILAIAITGIVIIRLSRASENAGIVVAESELQGIQAITVTNSQPITVNGYAEFHFTPQTTATIGSVAYYLDGTLAFSSDKSPYTYVLDTNRISNGNHSLTAVAFDANTKPVAATKRVLHVDNTQSIGNQARNIITYPWYWLFEL